MTAALEHVQERGIFEGLRVREIADRVGVTPANVYHYFGSLRGLLREALHREYDRVASELVSAMSLPFTERRLAVFDIVVQNKTIRLGALLALDGDPDFEPLPYFEKSLSTYTALQAKGELPKELDMQTLHLLTLAVSMGVAIYAEPASRQLDVESGELIERSRAMLEQLVKNFT